MSLTTCWKRPPRAEHSLSRLSIASILAFFTRVKTDFIFFTPIKITYISHNLHGQIFRHFWHQFVQKRHKFINKSLTKNDVFRQKNCWKNKNPTVRYTLETYRSQTKLTDLTEKETFRVATTLLSTECSACSIVLRVLVRAPAITAWNGDGSALFFDIISVF